MKYPYPKTAPYVSYTRVDADTVRIQEHISDTTFSLDIAIARYIRQLDGHTHPYRIPSRFSRDEIDDIIDFLGTNDLLHISTKHIARGSFLKSLWLPGHSSRLKIFAGISNFLLELLWLPVLIAGIVSVYLNHDTLSWISSDWLEIGLIFGLIATALFHELAHAFAGIAYNARVFEIGVMLMYFVLPGAYVLLDHTTVKKRWQRIQIFAAGIEANFLVGGLFLIGCTAVPVLSGALICAGISNLLSGLLNLMLITGFDGSKILSELLGIEDLMTQIKTIVFNKKARKRLRRKSYGFAAIAMCYILFVLQLSMPALLALNVLEVISCFI